MKYLCLRQRRFNSLEVLVLAQIKCKSLEALVFGTKKVEVLVFGTKKVQFARSTCVWNKEG